MQTAQVARAIARVCNCEAVMKRHVVTIQVAVG